MNEYQRLEQRIDKIQERVSRKEFGDKIFMIMEHHPEVSKMEGSERVVRSGFVIENLPAKYCYRVVTSNDRRIVYLEDAYVQVYHPGGWEDIIEKAYAEAARIEKDKEAKKHQKELEELRRNARENFGI